MVGWNSEAQGSSLSIMTPLPQFILAYRAEKKNHVRVKFEHGHKARHMVKWHDFSNCKVASFKDNGA